MSDEGKNNKDRTEIVNWDVMEYIPHKKNAGWYVGLAIISIALGGLSVWLQWWSFLVLIVVSVIALIIYSVRPPRVLHYSLSSKGLSEGNKLYDYSEFKSFGVLKEDEYFSIMLIPRKRFSPGVKVYFPEEKGEKIVDAFGARLPMQEVKLDLIDRLVNFLRI